MIERRPANLVDLVRPAGCDNPANRMGFSSLSPSCWLSARPFANPLSRITAAAPMIVNVAAAVAAIVIGRRVGAVSAGMGADPRAIRRVLGGVNNRWRRHSQADVGRHRRAERRQEAGQGKRDSGDKHQAAMAAPRECNCKQRMHRTPPPGSLNSPDKTIGRAGVVKLIGRISEAQAVQFRLDAIGFAIAALSNSRCRARGGWPTGCAPQARASAAVRGVRRFAS